MFVPLCCVVCVCVLAPGRPALTKLPVRGWHHLPPSQLYTEDNWALLWGFWGMSVQKAFLIFVTLSEYWFFLSFPKTSTACDKKYVQCLPLVLVIIAAWWPYTVLTSLHHHIWTCKTHLNSLWFSLTHTAEGQCVLGPVAPGCLSSLRYHYLWMDAPSRYSDIDTNTRIIHTKDEEHFISLIFSLFVSLFYRSYVLQSHQKVGNEATTNMSDWTALVKTAVGRHGMKLNAVQTVFFLLSRSQIFFFLLDFFLGRDLALCTCNMSKIYF